MTPEVEVLELPVGPLRFTARAAGPPDGRLVLLLHGFPQSSRQWRQQLTVLAGAGYRAVAPDQRGYSPGARPEAVDAYGLDHLVADVLALADELGGHRFDLVGHDWGAAVAWVVAARYPERVRTLTAVSVPHPKAFAAAVTGDTDQARRSAYVAFFRLPEIPERTLLAADGAGLRRALTATGLEEPEADEYVRSFVEDPGALRAALNWYRAIALDALPEVAPVEVPTLYVWSTEDPALGPDAAEGTAAHVRGPYRFEVLDGVGHWVPELAADRFNRLLLEHLAAHD